VIRTCGIPLGWCACLYCRWAVRLGQDQFSGVLESGAMRKSELHAIPHITLSQQRLKRRTNKGDANLSWRDRVDRRSVARCPTSTHRARWNSLSRCRCSLWRRVTGDRESLLSRSPLDAPADWIDWVNGVRTAGELDGLRKSVNRGMSYGSEDWMMRIANMLQLEFTLHPRGRPRREEC